MRRIGLYYPYIHCRDERWLKLTALYWPKLARVVPEGYPVADSDVVLALNDGIGFLESTRPDAAAEAIAPLFLDLLRERGDELRARYGVAEALPSNAFGVTTEPSAPWSAEQNHGRLGRHGLAGLHLDEMAPRLRDALAASDLAYITTRSRLDESATEVRWIAMRSTLAWVYKCALTAELARRTRYTPLTDQSDSHGTHGWDAARVAAVLLDPYPAARRPHEDVEDAIGLMSVRLVVPENLDDVPVEKIIRLRERHGPEFDAYAHAVSSAAADFRESLGAIEDAEARQRYLALKVTESFAAPLEDLRKAMRGLRIDTALSSLGAKVELGAAASLAAGSLPAGQPLATAGAAVLGIASLRRNAAVARDARMNAEPVAYLLRVERGLQPQRLHERVMRGIGRATGTSV
ncbi:DUF6236 family protein [Streptomyces uncialis]|uniref:DUF6236 family protein n=1 Tax=Streptomyces uncialis TaxID=1048205 RepID=UPI0037F4EE56